MMTVAFENAFDKLMEIMEFEGWTDGGKLFSNLLIDCFNDFVLDG